MAITASVMHAQKIQLIPIELQGIEEQPAICLEGYSGLVPPGQKGELSLLQQVRNVALSAKVIFFGPESQPLFSFLSNDYPSPLEFGGANYLCATSAYEAQKFLRQDKIIQRFTQLDAKGAYAFSTEKDRQKNIGWYTERSETMKNVLRAKFGQNPYLTQLLLATADAYLSFHTSHKKMDPYWTNDCDGSGANELGKLLMDIRWENSGCGRVAPPEKYKDLAFSQCISFTFPPCLNKSDEEIFSEIEKLNRRMKEIEDEYVSNTQIARLGENQAFTRFHFDNFPYDQTLVPLSSGRFINASFVLSREFIGTQSPMPGTMEDFWIMVLEHDVQVVIMLNRLGDPGDDIYFPFALEDSKRYGEIHLKLSEPPSFTTDPSWRQTPHEEERHAIIHRKVIIEYQGIERSVDHFQYQNWHDFSAGNERAAAHLVQIVNPIRKKSKAPTVIHCHAGVGRTAVAIALLSEAERIESGTVDIKRNVERQRSPEEGRCHSMMQAPGQYRFCYDTLRVLAQGS